MESVIFRVGKDKFTITRESILAAMEEYDNHHRTATNDAGRKYAIKHSGKLYPPKYVLSLVINRPRSSFCGGEGKNAANSVFRNLGFEIVCVNGSQGVPPRKSKEHLTKISAPIPDIQDLIRRLFSQRWTNLHANHTRLEDGEYPGVYVLAYSDDDLEGKQVKEEQVFYVGMSHTGIKRRLGQFIKGIEDGGHHSGASRFYTEYAGRIPYSQLQNRKTFYVASVAVVPCIVDKDRRTPTDLKKMGEVARLEFYVLAYIKEKLHTEPELNKK
jgi:hypothetical protein